MWLKTDQKPWTVWKYPICLVLSFFKLSWPCYLNCVDLFQISLIFCCWYSLSCPAIKTNDCRRRGSCTYLWIQNVHAVCKGTPMLSLLVKVLMVVGEKLLRISILGCWSASLHFSSPGRECEVFRSRQSVGQAGVGCYGQSLLAARHAHLKYFGVRWSGVWWGGVEVGRK